MSMLLHAPVNADGVIAELDLPQTAYRVLGVMRSRSEAGGRVELVQKDVAAKLRISRPAVTAALTHLILARLVTKKRNGTYQINPMIAGYESPRDLERAIALMDAADRLDLPEFVAQYHEAIVQYQEKLVLERRQRLRAVPA